MTSTTSTPVRWRMTTSETEGSGWQDLQAPWSGMARSGGGGDIWRSIFVRSDGTRWTTTVHRLGPLPHRPSFGRVGWIAGDASARAAASCSTSRRRSFRRSDGSHRCLVCGHRASRRLVFSPDQGTDEKEIEKEMVRERERETVRESERVGGMTR